MSGLWVRAAPASASTVRRVLGFELTEAGWPADAVDDLTLVATELVGNAVKHAQPMTTGHLHVEWEFSTDDVVISVTDGGSDSHSPQVRQAGPSEMSGRGLSIVAAVVDSWGVRTDSNGVTVWARRARPIADHAHAYQPGASSSMSTAPALHAAPRAC